MSVSQDVSAVTHPPSKRCRLPEFEDAENETLLNRSVQNLCEQYIEHFPEHVGALAARNGAAAAIRVAESLHSATNGEAIASITQSIQSLREESHLLQPCDSIAVISIDSNSLGGEDIRNAVRYEIVPVSHMKEYVVNVLQEWFLGYKRRTRNNVSDIYETERNGSAMLNEDGGLSTLEDYIERVAQDLSGQDADHGALQDNIDWIRTLVQEFLDDPGFECLHWESSGPFPIYRRVPKITIRYARGEF